MHNYYQQMPFFSTKIPEFGPLLVFKDHNALIMARLRLFQVSF